MPELQPHTPTVDELRRVYALKVPYDQRDRRNAEFDRFIAAAEQRGAIKALRNAATQMESTADTLGEHYILPGDIISWLRHRADQMEAEDD